MVSSNDAFEESARITKNEDEEMRSTSHCEPTGVSPIAEPDTVGLKGRSDEEFEDVEANHVDNEHENGEQLDDGCFGVDAVQEIPNGAVDGKQEYKPDIKQNVAGIATSRLGQHAHHHKDC